MHTTYLIVPAWSDQAGQCRIVRRDTDAPVRQAMLSYREAPDLWKEAGLMNSRGTVVCLDAPVEHRNDIRSCEPLMAGTSFGYEVVPA